MDPLLIRRWLEGGTFRSIVDAASISVARDDARAAATDAGFDATGVGEVALIVSELATNQLRHAKNGRIALRSIEREGTPGVEILAVDRGEGIADPTGALAGVPRAEGSMGVGLSSVLRMSAEVDFDIRAREGSCIRARKFIRHVGRRREVAVLGRPIDGEPRSGDDAWFDRRGDRLVIALADGLGHGNDAREAATRAIEAARIGDEPVARLCERADVAARGTRGTVLGVVELDERERRLRLAGGGNVLTHVVGPRGTRPLSTQSAVLGSASKQAAFGTEELALDAHDTLVMFTDGVSARLRLDVRDAAFRGHPLAIAAHVLEQFGRANDDATVIVVR